MRGCRPDIAYQVGALSRVAHCFNDKHIAAAHHLLRYLRTTKDLQLVYKRNLDDTNRQPEVWVDADYSPDYGGWAGNYRSALPHGSSFRTTRRLTGALDGNNAWRSPQLSPSTTPRLTPLKKQHDYELFTTISDT
jgi:hypothetical protein